MEVLDTHLIGISLALHKQARRDAVGPLEMGIHLSYGLWDWLQLKGGAGYRIVLPNKNPELNSVYYKVGASVNLRLLKKKLNSQHPK
jgi:hypothetical protein